MSKKKKQVGKGIRALLSNIENNQTSEPALDSVKELNNDSYMVPISQIETNPYQPRQDFDEEELQELSTSISVHGLIQPVTLRSLGDNSFQLISGERRLRASKLAGLTEVPAYIRLANDQEMLEMALIENIQRSNLNAIEIAISYQRLIDECSLTHETMSHRVGKKRSTISNYIRLLKLPPIIQSSIKEGKISMGHARALAGIDEVDKQLAIFKEVVDRKLSVRGTENLISQYGRPTSSSTPASASHEDVPSEVRDFIERLRGKLGTKVDINRNNKGAGKIVIKFNTDREFNFIMDLLDD